MPLITNSVDFNLRRSIWQQISLGSLKNIAEQEKPSHNWQITHNSLRGNCIHHSEDTPSLYITPGRGIVKCFGCNYFEWDPIKFVADLTGKTEGEAIALMINAFNLKLPKRVQQDINNWQNVQVQLYNISRAMNRALQEATPDDEVAAPLLRWLEERQISIINELPIGILHEPTVISRYLSKNDAVVYKEMFKQYNPHWIGSAAFTYHIAPKDITGFKLRRDFLLEEHEKSQTPICFVWAADTNHQGFFLLGQPIYSTLLGHDQEKQETLKFIVEGETDAIMWYQKMLTEQHNVDVMVLGSGGTGSANLDPLNVLEINQVNTVSDHPDYQGDSVTKKYLRGSTSMNIRCFVWPEHWHSKDPDDFLKTHSYDEWKQVVYETDNIDYYQPTHLWAYTRAHDKVVKEDDFRKQIEIISSFGRLLNDPSERDLYAVKMSKLTGLSEYRIRRTLISQRDDPDGFIARIEQKLRQEYDFIGKKPTKTGGTILGWSRRKQDIVKWRITRQRDLETYLSYDLGALYNWVGEHIGIPRFISHDAKGNKKTPIHIESELRGYVDLAVKQIKMSLRNVSNYEIKREGLHWIKNPKTNSEGIYIVNENHRFAGTFEDDHLTWSELESPVVGNTILYTGEKWTNNIMSIDDLEYGRNVDIKEVFETIKNILDIGWNFSSQDVDTTFLSLSFMSMFVINTLPRQQLIIVNAPRQSGKSMLLKGLMSGEQNKNLHVLECTRFFGEDYTAASLRQQMRGVGLHPTLDEFEDKDDSRQSQRIRELLWIFRGMVGGSAKIFRGSRDGENPLEYGLKFSPFCASIHTLRESVDITRFCRIILEQVPGRESPERSILREYSIQDIKELRRKLTTCMFYQIPAIHRMYNKIQNIIEDSKYLDSVKTQTGGIIVDTRFLGNLIAPASLYAHMGYDAMRFLAQFISTREDVLQQQNKATEHRSLYQTLLSASHKWRRVSSEGRPYYDDATLRTLLKDPTDRDVINESPSGVKYIRTRNDKHWLVVHWQEALSGVLRWTVYGKETPHRMRNMAMNVPETVNPNLIRKAYIIKKLFGPGTDISDISAFDITHEITDYEEINNMSDEELSSQEP